MIRSVSAAASGPPCTGRFFGGLLWWVVTLWLSALSALPAQAATYSFKTGSFGWESASNVITWDRTCTSYPNDDDKATVRFTEGFTFALGGVAYSQVQVLSNGVLQFVASDNGFQRSYTNTRLPAGKPVAGSTGCASVAPGAALMVYWTDLDPSTAGNVTWQQKGMAPNRYLVVSWNAVYQYGTSTPYSFQVVLYENGEFKYQYGNSNASGSNATIGVQLSATDHTLYAHMSGYNANGSAIRWFQPSTDPVRLAEFRFDEYSYRGAVGEVRDSSGNDYGGTRVGNAASVANGKVCRGLQIPADTSTTVSAVDTGVDLDSAVGNSGGITFWYQGASAWGSGNDLQLLDATSVSNRSFHLVRRGNGTLRLAVSDSAGKTLVADSAAQSFAANTWVHISVTWRLASGVNQSVVRIYINGVLSGTAIDTTSGNLDPSLGSMFVGDNRSGITSNNATVNAANGVLDELRIYNYEISGADMTLDRAQTHPCAPPLDHLEIQHASGTGLTCSPTTVTVRACQDAACSALYTGGVSGLLRATGGSVVWPATEAFNIPSGGSSTTVSLQVTTTTATVLGVVSSSLAPRSAASCNFGNPSCTFTAADAGLLFDVPHHRAGLSNTVSVAAVKKADASTTCVPAFASVSKVITFTCAYTNPASGSQAVRVGGLALNGTNNAAAACDGGGRAVTLAFDSTGRVSTSVQYADAGTVALTGRYSGSGPDAGLTMTGSDSFTAAPHVFSVAGPASGNLVAGSAFSATVVAKNLLGNPMPNFGQESPRETVSLGWVRTQPQGSGASNGSFSGSLGSFSGGTASSQMLQWTEVGRGELTARLGSGNYLGSGLHAAGASNALVSCSNEGGTCVLPTGATAVVYYGANGVFATRAGVTGSIGCGNASFGDPLVGASKSCLYALSTGSSPASTGSVGPFIPHHFDVTATAACSTFTYAGQPFTATVTARNAAGATTVNYDGSAGTSPNFAKATALTDVPVLGLGSWSDNGLVASAFASGVATATPSYAFTHKTTAPQSLVVRATDTDAVSSLGFAEPTLPLRSGRLRLSNAFGSAGAALKVPVVAEHWSGNAWVLNSADSCTALTGANVALSNPRGAGGAASAGSTSAGAVTLAAGSGFISLAAPSPAGSSLSLDLAINLGSTASDQSCHASHPASTGAAKPWLRAQNGSCAASADRDPAARASFGIFSPETRKTVHVRELF